MCGKLQPKEAWQTDSLFNKTHAMAYDEALIQRDTVTESKPVFTQKYTLVQFFETVEEGFEYPSSNWPLHATVVDTFAIDWSVDELAKRLSTVLSHYTAVSSQAGDDTAFGDHEHVRVTLIDRTERLVKLHEDIVSALKDGGLVLNEPQFAQDGFLPHATVQKHNRLNKGDVVKFTALSIVDMFPEGDPYRRKVLKTIQIGG